MELGEINNVSEPITEMTRMDIKHMHNFLVSHIRWKWFRHHPNPFLKKLNKWDGKREQCLPRAGSNWHSNGCDGPFYGWRTWMARRFANWWQGQNQASGLQLLWVTSFFCPSHYPFPDFPLGDWAHDPEPGQSKYSTATSSPLSLFPATVTGSDGQIFPVRAMKSVPGLWVKLLEKKTLSPAGIASWWVM